MKFSTIEAVILDMDGVLWRGEQPLLGHRDLFDWLNENQTPYVLATNNSSNTQADYVAKLARLGVPNVLKESIVTSSTATASYLAGHYPAGTRVHVLGMKGLRDALESAGFDIDDANPDLPQVVVSGIDFDLTYDKLKQAALYIRQGAAFIGTNPDKTFPMPEGLVPGAGSVIAALETATDQKAIVIGKPGKPMFEAALKVLNTPASATLMVGDRLDTDIGGAKAAGLPTALVFTGVTSPADLTGSDIWPDVAYEDLPSLLRAWAGDDWYLAKVKAQRGR